PCRVSLRWSARRGKPRLYGCFDSCESGEIGRRTRLRIWRGNPWGFESPLSHHIISNLSPGGTAELRQDDSPPGAKFTRPSGTEVGNPGHTRSSASGLGASCTNVPNLFNYRECGR